MVPGPPNYKAWENKKVLSGLRFELKRLIKDSGDTLENAIRSNLHGEAKDVASAMSADTKTFLMIWRFGFQNITRNCRSKQERRMAQKCGS